VKVFKAIEVIGMTAVAAGDMVAAHELLKKVISSRNSFFDSHLGDF